MLTELQMTLGSYNDKNDNVIGFNLIDSYDRNSKLNKEAIEKLILKK